MAIYSGFSHSKYFKMAIFHSYVSLPEAKSDYPVCGIGTFSNGSINVAMRASREIAMGSKKEESLLALIIIFQKSYHHYNSEILISSFSSSLFALFLSHYWNDAYY